ncbi:MAG: TIGR00159 family protein [Eubacterium sp.]|nr:TIGR00159 family protein [Eubacterium sp.]MCI8917197.1 TIGR00159 family protein [Eubacterium sp.]
MQWFAEKYMFWITPQKITTIDAVEILLLTCLFYHVLVWIKDTRAWMLFKGIIVILIFIVIAAVFQMNTILWLASKTVNVALIALAVIFQPELRKALDQLGRKKFVTALFDFGMAQETGRFSDRTINELAKASFEMGKVKTGALIVVEQDIVLTEYERTGIELDSLLSSQLLVNIFEKNTPLHDGAIIVRGNRVVAATCYLPLSDSMSISKELGTRHRAAIGISEVSDSLTIIVSEETGAVSVAKGGRIYRELTQDGLREQLKIIQNAEIETSRLHFLQRRLRDVKKRRKKAD